MSIKIIAKSIKEFEKVESGITPLGETFFESFDTAELLLSGFDDIKLSKNDYFKDTIELPHAFTIKMVNFEPFETYEKDSGDIIETRIRYILTIKGEIEKQTYTLVFGNLLNNRLKISS